MLYKRFVEVGRVVLVNYGEDYGKLAVVVDVLDHNRVLVDAPAPMQAPMARQVLPLARASLTDIIVPLKGHGAKTGTVAKALKSCPVDEQWAASAWGQKLAKKEKRKAMNDLDRFKLMLAKKKKSKLIAAKLKV